MVKKKSLYRNCGKYTENNMFHVSPSRQLHVQSYNRRQWRRFGGFIVNFEHISHLCSSISVVNFEQVNAGWAQIFTIYILCPFHKLCKMYSN